MKEHPILFTGEMVRAILEGRKTQTRRVIKPQPGNDNRIKWPGKKNIMINIRDERVVECCPYGQPGDRLWGQETFYELELFFEGPYLGHQFGEAAFGPDCWAPWSYLDEADINVFNADWDNKYKPIWYAADGAIPTIDSFCEARYSIKKPSIHMPRWASRITLEVKNVRVERVQDISEEDAKAEGVLIIPNENESGPWTHKRAFVNLWNSINAKRGFGWDVNPWVWVIEFEVI